MWAGLNAKPHTPLGLCLFSCIDNIVVALAVLATLLLFLSYLVFTCLILSYSFPQRLVGLFVPVAALRLAPKTPRGSAPISAEAAMSVSRRNDYASRPCRLCCRSTQASD